MKYLKLSNKGEIDVRLIFLMGATTKTDDLSKIGKFGTGMKYAISYFLRNGIDFKVFSGENEVMFNTEEQVIGNNVFEEIYCNGKSMNITTHYGHQWQAWEALREIWCNAKDEGLEGKKTLDSRSVMQGTKDTTCFYIQMTKEIREVYEKWGSYFLEDVPLYEDDSVAIYKNTEGKLKLYKNTVLIEDSEVYNSLFHYDIKQAELNELRQYRGYHKSDIGRALLNSNKAVIELLLEAIKANTDCMEVKLDWDYLTYDAKKVKMLFGGNLYLHPESDATLKGRFVKVNATLFNLLQKVGLPCEKVTKTYGGYFGGSGAGYSDAKAGSYKKIEMPELKVRIDAILSKYNEYIEYIIAQPIKSDFEMVWEYKKAIFSSSLEHLSDADLESTVLIGILHSKNKNLYKVLKRLVKMLYKKEFFKQIFFGTREEKKAIREEFDLVEDDLLPF